MRGAQVLTLCAAVLFGAAASTSAAAQGDAEQGCDGSTVEMVECLGRKAAQWDKRLNAAYQKLLKLVQGKQREQLRTAQRSWVQYRDANCLYWALGEGTIARLESADCNYRMTKERAEELEGATER
jgi:uncharacterized protein YecT (DUF1311 family)